MTALTILSILAAFVSAEPLSAKQDSTPSSCCETLNWLLPGKVAVQGDTSYNSSLQSYWSAQEQSILPTCVVLPTSADEVSRIILTLTAANSTDCTFAVRGGGHASFANFANIHNGVTIDLQALNDVTLSADKSLAHVGGGSRWGKVYKTIVPEGKAILGGRLESVGVPGLTTGGGYSYFSPKFGFVADGVANFEVVLANGTQISANQTSHAGLFRALKGGQNNFGVITRFDFRTFDQGDLWSATLIHPITASQQAYTAFENFGNTTNNDPDAALITSFTATDHQTWTLSSTMKYIQPVARPPAFEEFLALPTLVTSETTADLLNLTTGEALGPEGFRWLSATATYTNNATMMERFMAYANQTLQDLPLDPGFTFSINLQPLTKHTLQAGNEFGGNSFGLGDTQEDFVLYVATLRWTNTANDETNERLLRELFEKSDARARSMGMFHPFKYLNYAGPWQDAIASFGQQAVQDMQKVSRAYDPRKVFQKQVPGGFKLPKSRGCNVQ